VRGAGFVRGAGITHPRSLCRKERRHSPDRGAREVRRREAAEALLQDRDLHCRLVPTPDNAADELGPGCPPVHKRRAHEDGQACQPGRSNSVLLRQGEDPLRLLYIPQAMAPQIDQGLVDLPRKGV
jgi:hypothetical protein